MISGRHFISVEDFTKPELEEVIRLAEKLKDERAKNIDHRLLDGKSLALIFLQPSNRTRLSFEIGMFELGGKTINIRPEEIKLGEREPISDVARVMSRYVDAVMMRVVKHEHIVEFAKYSTVPIINGLSDKYHPCQAISDILTIQEKKGKLAGLKLCYIGDGNNVCVSLIHAARVFGIEMVVSCPKGYEPMLEGNGYEVIHNPEQAIEGADVVYTDVWTSMGYEEETARRLKKFKGYTITEQLFAKAAPDAIFMHCLPAHRGEEVTHEVVEHPRSVIFDQAENRLHAQKAVLALLLKSE
ncbi:MAG: ornithine carbamoyltransferase [Bdellovibrionota bacterium]